MSKLDDVLVYRFQTYRQWLSAWFVWSGIIVLLDQVTKQSVGFWLSHQEVIPVFPFLNITLLHNPGAAFSFLASAPGWQRWFFIVLTLCVSAIIIHWLHQLRSYEQMIKIALSCILGGALGNLIDRLFYGYVVDFIDFYYKSYHFPAFNIADSAITIGTCLLAISTLWLTPERNRFMGKY